MKRPLSQQKLLRFNERICRPEMGNSTAYHCSQSKHGIGSGACTGLGTYSFQVKDPQQLVTQLVGAQGIYRTSDIEGRLRSMLLSKLQDLLGETAAKNSVPELIGLTDELGRGRTSKNAGRLPCARTDAKSFLSRNLKPSSKSAEELHARWVRWTCKPIPNCKPLMRSGMLPRILAVALDKLRVLALVWVWVM